MASEQDLQSAIAAVGQAVTQFGAEVEALKSAINALIAKIAAAGTIPDADVQALVGLTSALGTSNEALQAAVDEANAAVNPPAPPVA